MGGTIKLSLQPDLIASNKYDHIRLPPDLIDLSRFDHVTDLSPEDFEALRADARKLEVESKVRKILLPLFQPFQNENDQDECVRNVSRELQAYLQDIKGVDPEFFAERYSIGLAVLGRYWPAAYEKSIKQLARFFVISLKSSPEYGHACLTALTAEERWLKQGNFFPLGAQARDRIGRRRSSGVPSWRNRGRNRPKNYYGFSQSTR
jgi:hypothetical protein